MVAALAAEIVARMNAGVDANGVASLIVSGGTTPGVLFDRLSQQAAPWDKTWITLSDERWIVPTHVGSNEHLVRTRLLRGKAANAHFVPLKTDDARPEAGEHKADAAIRAMHKPFDVTLLGMGDDGHTASLYPGAPELAAALDVAAPALVHAVHAQKAAATDDRMTLTLRALLDSKWLAVLIRGDAKLKTYEAALGDDDPCAMPVRAILNQSRVPVSVFWSP